MTYAIDQMLSLTRKKTGATPIKSHHWTGFNESFAADVLKNQLNMALAGIFIKRKTNPDSPWIGAAGFDL